MRNFGENLRELREQKGYSQLDLAKEIHVCRENISKWETGKASPQLKWVYEIAKALGVNPTELVRT